MKERHRSTRRFFAVVLGSRAWREKDRIVHLLAERYGRLDAVAYGARGESGRWAGRLDPFTPLDLLLYRRGASGLWTVREATPRAPGPPDVSGDWRRSLALQSAAELLVHASPGEETAPEAFDLALALPRELAAGPQPVTVLLAFFFAWAGRAGFGPPQFEVSARAARFLERVYAGSPRDWHRFRLPPPLAAELVRLARAHAEFSLEKRWRGIDMLGRML